MAKLIRCHSGFDSQVVKFLIARLARSDPRNSFWELCVMHYVSILGYYIELVSWTLTLVLHHILDYHVLDVLEYFIIY